MLRSQSDSSESVLSGEARRHVIDPRCDETRTADDFKFKFLEPTELKYIQHVQARK